MMRVLAMMLVMHHRAACLEFEKLEDRRSTAPQSHTEVERVERTPLQTAVIEPRDLQKAASVSNMLHVGSDIRVRG